MRTIFNNQTTFVPHSDSIIGERQRIVGQVLQIKSVVEVVTLLLSIISM